MALIPSAWCATTNDLTALLQSGLFEEQANRNLDAAIADYAALATQFDKDRQLAATAVFRLGECYRAQGKTNEAAAQYQRILRDFSDQQTLATLSRQDLAGMGIEPKTMAAISTQPAVAAAGAALELEKELALLKAQIELSQHETNLVWLIESVGDKKWLDDFNTRERVRSSLENVKAGGKSEWTVADLEGSLATMDDKLKADFDHWLAGQDFRRRYLESAIAQTRGLSAANPSTSSPATAMTDEESHEIERIQQMIQNSPDLINAPGEGGNPPLTQAAYKGWLKVATYLVDHGADVNGGGVAPLNAAAASGNRAMVELLLSRGADVNSKGSQGKTPLNTAVEKKFQAVVEVLLANKADVNAEGQFGATPLASAAINKQVKTIQSLLAAGASPNLENKNGRTPLSFAAESGSPEIVKMFLSAKADPNGGKLDAPLLAAIHANDVASAELLLQAGAKSNVKGKAHWRIQINNTIYENSGFDVTPLWLAVYLKQLPMVQLLLKFKADPNDSQIGGFPVAFGAMSNPNIPEPEILEALLDAGAKVDARNQSVAYNNVNVDQPLLDRAIEIKNAASVEALLKHGANVNAANGNGYTPLHTAAAYLVDQKIFELLLAAKADPNIRNNDGKTPLDLLAENSTQTISPSGLQVGGTTFQTRLQNIIKHGGSVESAKVKPAGELADLLRQHGALDNLPDWNRIAVSRPANDSFAMIFQRGTNDWNHFTLVELIYLTTGSHKQQIPFPDLTRMVIARPDAHGAAAKRIEVNLLNATNGVDFEKDVPLEFGDVVEIPERGHTLAEQDHQLNSQYNELRGHFSENAGAVSLIVAGGQTVQVALKNFDPLTAYLGAVLRSSEAQNVLTSGSDLSRVKIKRRDVKTKKMSEWILDCSQMNPANGYPYFNCPDLLLRDGDVIEVPEKR